MIVNPWSITGAVVDLLSSGLALSTVGLSGHLLLHIPGRNAAGEQVSMQENRLYLVFWMGCVLLLIRALAWPFFYLVLHSFVSEVQGTMCIFGVRNLMPRLTRFLELIKPLLFFLGLVWLVLFRLERTGEYDQEAGRRGRLIILVLLLASALTGCADSLGSLLLWIRSSAELAVSCCTTVTDIPSRFTVWIPLSLFGPAYERPLWYGYFASTVLVLLLAWMSRLYLDRRGFSARLMAATAMAGLLNAVVTVLATIEVIAPMLMQLPFHHCLYCMLQKVADAPLFAGLFVVATCCVCAVFPVWLLARSWSAPGPLQRTLTLLLDTGCLALAGSLLMVCVHLVLLRG